jgi:disulfide bond formation protein DsbB
VGLVGVGVTWLGLLLERIGVGRLGSAIGETISGAEVWLAFLVALVATGGSLYFSESVGYIPCVLCWYQRIAMYPLVVLMLVAIVRRERVVAPYAFFVALAGLAVSIYHYQLEWFPDQGSLCSLTASVPCHVVWFKHFGVATIPFLAGSGFLMIGTLMWLAWRSDRIAAQAAPVAQGAVEAGEPASGVARSSGIAPAAIGVVAALAVAAVLALLLLRGGDDGGETATQTPITRPGDATAGKALFASEGCGGCHTLTAAGTDGTTGPNLDATALDEAAIREVIASGKGAMPGFDGDLTPQEIADLAVFVGGR